MVKKTIHELTQEFPEKTYKELEKYRDADRQQEAQQILIKQENEELKENQLTESERRQMELEPIEREDWKEKYEREHKLRQEAEGELSIVKGIGMNSPEAIKLKKEICELRQDNRKLSKQVEDSVDRMRKAGM
jgi:hypothetical protein